MGDNARKSKGAVKSLREYFIMATGYSQDLNAEQRQLSEDIQRMQSIIQSPDRDIAKTTDYDQNEFVSARNSSDSPVLNVQNIKSG